MHTYRFNGTVLLRTSLAHNGGEVNGTITQFRRKRFRALRGGWNEVPVYSGNALNGILRRLGMLHMLRTLGYDAEVLAEAADAAAPVTDTVDDGGRPPQDEQQGLFGEEQERRIKRGGLSLAAFYFLFSGGALTSTGSRGIDVEEARKLRELIPLVGVFGGAMGNQMMPGCRKISDLYPLCGELIALLPASFILRHETRLYDVLKTQGDPKEVLERLQFPTGSLDEIQRSRNMLAFLAEMYMDPAHSLLQEEMFTRRDDAKNDRMTKLMSDNTRYLLESDRKAALARKNAGKPKAADEIGNKQQGIYEVETLMAGTPLYLTMTLEDASDLEYEAFFSALNQLHDKPYIGGKSGVGYGEISLHIDEWSSLNSRLSPMQQAIDLPMGQRYYTHLQTHAADIRAFLASMV